jgi:pimeloyl-ACP methyl ester carboxylesterase
MNKLFIKNRKEQKVCILLEKSLEQRGLVFIMHGLGGWKEQGHIDAFAQAFKDNQFTVVRFDATNSYGESDGDYADATTTNYYEDLEDVIAWAASQSFYEEPFFLAGHSLGGISTALYAQKYPEKVRGLAPISTVVSGKLSQQTKPYSPEVLEEWKKTGWLIKESYTKPGLMKKIKWSEMEDRLKYDLLTQVNKLDMPVLLIVGSEDEGTPPEHQKILFDALPGKKELHILNGGPHTFIEQQHLKEIREIMDRWIRTVN